MVIGATDRFVLTLGAVMLFVTVAVLYSRSDAEPLTPVCVTDEDRVHIRAQVLLAVDDAFKDNMKNLFTGWLKDAHQQPERASAGLQSSIVAYQRARADALKWNPKSC
jgi:hypothetical protein